MPKARVREALEALPELCARSCEPAIWLGERQGVGVLASTPDKEGRIGRGAVSSSGPTIQSSRAGYVEAIRRGMVLSVMAPSVVPASAASASRNSRLRILPLELRGCSSDVSV